MAIKPEFGIRWHKAKAIVLYCVSNENYTFGIGVRNHLRTARKELRTPDC